MRTLVLLVVLAGCSKGGGGGDTFDEILGELQTFKDQMCACKDSVCADKVSEARREYKKTMRDKLAKGAKPTADQDKRGRELEEQLGTCRRALTGGDSGSAGSAEPAE